MRFFICDRFYQIVPDLIVATETLAVAGEAEKISNLTSN
jgi:hypothetical protein